MSLRHFLICFALTGFLGNAYAGIDEGVEAYLQGDFKTAIAEFRPLAEQGDAKAQNHLGVVYSAVGDHKEAAKWFRKAADQGNADAQYNLQFE